MKIKRYVIAAGIALLFTWCLVGVFALGYVVFNAVDNWLDGGTANFAFIAIFASGIFLGIYLSVLAHIKKKEKP